MNKNTLWLMVVLLAMYLTLVFCEEQQQQQQQELQENSETALEAAVKEFLGSDSTELSQDEARTRRRHRHHLYARWGWTAIAIAYLIKIKVVIVAFFVGSAVYLGLRYLWPHKCQPEIILDHPPPFISSSWGGSSPGASFDPYSAYAGSYGSSDVSPPEAPSADVPSYRIKREVIENVEQEESRQMGPAINEEKIGNFMFMFLGLDSMACRRRFICEMEFRSKTNPLTAMAFRVVGRSFFAKYTNDRNEMGQANSFEECAAVNSECVFIENDNNNQEQEEQTHEEESSLNNTAAESESNNNDLNSDALPTEEDADNNSIENNNIEERANYQNLMAERRHSYWRHRSVRGGGDRQF
ncbi:uncharacterized protein LOC133322165 [Musca vetustissima]|uniref:uncharacterized protein LOC133322165 n=1 Tax=Musca vetustissima TaxID=27455 RepID=UPI002AB76BF6|nr:uncharacterized protein LOC133322165 [Musca vetustissima]